jgi:hypothetical protein
MHAYAVRRYTEHEAGGERFMATLLLIEQDVAGLVQGSNAVLWAHPLIAGHVITYH